MTSGEQKAMCSVAGTPSAAPSSREDQTVREPSTVFRVLDLFSGIGGFSLGLERTGGFETVAFCEIDPHARRVLKEHWPDVPCFEDVRTVTRTQLAEANIYPDFICGGFPCQDISVANTDAAGLAGARSGLFWEVHRLIGELRPQGVLLENVAALLDRGLGDVLGALAAIGYDAEWHCIPAAHVGAPHRRDRIWILANPSDAGWQGSEPIHRALEREIATLAQHDDPFAHARRVLDGDLSGLRAGDGLSVGMERRRLHQTGNAVVPLIPELIGRAILAAEASLAEAA